MDQPSAVLTGDQILELQQIVRKVPVTDHVIQYTLALVRQVVSCCVERLCPDRSRKGLVEPSPRAIAAQTRLERERARARHAKRRPALREFWHAHLDRPVGAGCRGGAKVLPYRVRLGIRHRRS